MQPIRKIGPTEVALTTFYGKCFVQTNEHKVNNWSRWIIDEVSLASEGETPTITDVSYSNVYDNEAKLPREYSLIAREIDSLNANGYHYNFDHKRINKLFGVETVEKLAKDKLTPIAKTRGKLLAMDETSAVYEVVGDKITPAEKLSVQLGIPSRKEPKEFTEVKILRNFVPLVLFFGYHFGLEGTLRRFNTTYQFIPPGDKVTVEDGILLKLKEGRLLIQPKNRREALIFNALLRYKDIIKELSLHDLNSQAAYSLLLGKDKLGSEYITEFINIEKGFVDAYHHDVLKGMGEPTNFVGLLIRSNELMDDATHPKETDINHMHILSHHRFAGHLYKELSMSMRRYYNSPPNSRKLELKPRAVWSAIDSDTSVLTAQDSTPLQSIKEADVVTFGGTNGRSRVSMVKRTREYNASDLGIISGDTVDSTDVAITAMMSNDANVKDVYGNLKTTDDVEDLEHGEIFSFCNSVAPDVDTDDSKRVAFVGIQMGSAAAAVDATCPAYRTPSHLSVAHRASDSYAVAAKDDGKVVEITEHGITVAFKDGTRESYSLDRWYGSYEGSTYPHDMATTFKVGDKVEKNDIITYSPNHFEPDFKSPRQVNWKAGVMATVVLINSEETHEDSDEIAEWLSNSLSHDGTKVKHVTLDATQNVVSLLKAGASVDYDTALCIIDEVEQTGELSDATMEVLSDIASQSPKAGVRGVVDRIEVIYNGEYEEMSDSIQTIVRKGDRQRRLLAKHSPEPIPETGKVDSDFRVDGEPVTQGKVVLTFYITHRYSPRGASKLVFGNQMKSVIKSIMVGENYTEDKRNIDAKFGRQGVDDRIVGSFQNIMLKGLFCHELARECRELRDS